MDLRKLRDYNKLFWSLLFSWLYIPHLVSLLGKQKNIFSDLDRIKYRYRLPDNNLLLLIVSLHTDRYFRSLFYFRIGPIRSILISWYRPGDKYFTIPYSTKIGKGVCLYHPYSTILNAESIGDNFSCGQCTTIGKTIKGRPVIGDNVSVGANSVIVGKIAIGDNVTIGAGSIVVKDVQDNCVIAGNPAKIIRIKE